MAQKRKKKRNSKNSSSQYKQSSKVKDSTRNIMGTIVLALGAIPYAYVNFINSNIGIWISFSGSFLIVIGCMILFSGIIRRKIWFIIFILPLALLFYISFLSSTTEKFPQSILNSSVSRLQILLVFKHPLSLESLKTSQMIFNFKGVGGWLELKSEIFSVTDRDHPGPLQIYGAKKVIPNLFISIIKNPNSFFPEKDFIGVKKIFSDTLAIEVKLIGNTPFPFRDFRDFKGMNVTPYLPQNIVALLKEMIIKVNNQIILRGQSEKAKWMDVQYSEGNNMLYLLTPTEPNLLQEYSTTPKELWQIDF
ncbi:MAG: hypothetical protein C4539_02990 [Ignavibacteriales bacterium]|nr:MAG: hypothetical protein C4539_02990 [Ignavibacteriales bacterium]